MASGKPTLHQITDAAAPGDAVSDQVFAIRRWLRELGFNSEIFSAHSRKELTSEVKLLGRYRPNRSERYLIYHHGIGSEAVEQLVAWNLPLILIYHNITPPEFYQDVDPALASQLIAGRSQLATLRGLTSLALGDSHYSIKELAELGYENTGVLPIFLNESEYDLPSNPAVAERFRDHGPVILFVGRLAPNKKQEDLIKLLHFYRRVRPGASLVLVGSIHHRDYMVWLQELCRTLDLEDAVHFTGHVSQQDMVTYYRLADLYVSMSEHEGFGKPLIESMYLDLPLMAYASSAVPFTMGEAGVLFHRKEFEALAELADMLVTDMALREQIIVRQRERVQDFLEESVKGQLQQILKELNFLPSGTSSG
jgi:glycosyltransferase involved in cell wall biosynthesis